MPLNDRLSFFNLGDLVYTFFKCDCAFNLVSLQDKLHSQNAVLPPQANSVLAPYRPCLSWAII